MIIQGREYDVVKISLGLVAVVAVSSALWNWYNPKIQNTVDYQVVKEEKIVEKIKRVTIPGPERIVTIEKQVIVDKLGLPAGIANDSEKVVTANADIPPSEGGTSAVSILDTRTGITEIIAKEKPVSLFGFPSNIEAGVRYGITSSGPQQGNMFARWQFLRVGKIYVGAYGEIATKPEAKAMIEAAWRW